MLPIDDIAADSLADELLARPPEIGYLTISTALQWWLQFKSSHRPSWHPQRHSSDSMTYADRTSVLLQFRD